MFPGLLSRMAILVMALLLGSATAADAEPRLCSRKKQISTPGLVVDQAWQRYRNLEINDPKREGWCGCAKQCVPSVQLAAGYEDDALANFDAAHDSSLSQKQRSKHLKAANELFRRRTDTVGEFTACLIDVRPRPIVTRAGADRIPGGCELNEDLVGQWNKWCQSYQAAFQKVGADFVKRAHSTVWLKFQIYARPSGEIVENAKFQTKTNLDSSSASKFKDDVRKINPGPMPDASQYSSGVRLPPGWPWTICLYTKTPGGNVPAECVGVPNVLPCPED